MFAPCVLAHMMKMWKKELVLNGWPVLVDGGSMKTALKIVSKTVVVEIAAALYALICSQIEVVHLLSVIIILSCS